MAFSISAKLMRVGVADHRHDQALLGADGDADVVVVLVDRGPSPSISALTAGHLLQRVRRTAFTKKRHEAELHAVLLLEDVLVLACAAP